MQPIHVRTKKKKKEKYHTLKGKCHLLNYG